MDPSIEVSTDDLERTLQQDDAQVVDVREGYEREAGHIEGTRHVELPELAAQAGSIDRDRPVVFTCRSGGRSLVAAQAFRQAGYDAWSHAGGILDWEAQGKPIAGGGEVAVH